MAEFPPGEWGTYGQWASALVTGSAFFATFYVIRRDAKVRRYAQARKVVFYSEELRPARGYQYTVRNLSDEPIYGVVLYKEHPNTIFSLDKVLLPGKDTPPFVTKGDNSPPLRLAFRDNGGWNWNRDTLGFLREGGGPVNKAKRTVESKKTN